MRFPFFIPDDTPGAGETTPEGGGGAKTEEEPTGVTISQEEYDELIARKDLDPDEYNRFKSIAEASTEMWRSGGNVNDNARIVLKHANWSDEQIDAFLSEATEEETQEVADNPGQSKGEESVEVRKLREDFERDRAQRAQSEQQAFVQEVFNRIDGEIERQIESGELKDLVDTIRKGEDGEQRAANLVKGLKKRLDADLRPALNSRRMKEARRLGKESAWDHSWISDEAGKLAKEIHKEVRSVIGDKGLGRSPETATGFEHLAKKEKRPEPKFEPGKTSADIRAEIESAVEDDLGRAILKGSEGI